MQLPQIRIDSTFARIGLTTEKPVQEIRQPKADLSIRQPAAELSIESMPGKLTIDQTEAWEDMDLKPIFQRIKEFADNGYQDWLQGLARMSQQGNELMKIENGGNPIASQAKANSEDSANEFNIGWIPSLFSVKINYAPTKLNINWNQNKPVIEAIAKQPVINYTPGKASTYIEQMNSLKIDFENLNFIGINYEQKI